jgi:hypothetical protein
MILSDNSAKGCHVNPIVKRLVQVGLLVLI